MHEEYFAPIATGAKEGRLMINNNKTRNQNLFSFLIEKIKISQKCDHKVGKSKDQHKNGKSSFF